jgi:hypothetical protein
MHKDKWCKCNFVSVVSSFHDTKIWAELMFVSNETHWMSAWVAKLCWSVCNHGCFLCHAQGWFEIKVNSSSGTHWHKTISRASKEAIYAVSAMCLLLVCFAPLCFSPSCSVCACSQLLGFWLSFCSCFFVNSQNVLSIRRVAQAKNKPFVGYPFLHGINCFVWRMVLC